MNVFKKSVLAAGLAASAFAATTPAMAQDYYRHHDNTAGVAIGAGILGLAVGAIVASNTHHDRYYDEGGYAPGWSYSDGYYRDGSGHRFSREEYVRRNPDFGHGPDHGPDRGPDHGQGFTPADRHDGPRGDDARRGYDRDGGDFRRGY